MIFPQSLMQIWNQRQSDRVAVMRLSDKTIYWILNQDLACFESFSSAHGILNIGMKDAETPDWVEWNPHSAPTLH